MKRITALLLVAVLLCAFCFTVSAASQNQLSVIVQKLDTASGNYVNANSLVAGDVIRVDLAIPNPVTSIAALRIKLLYDSNKLTYVTGSAQNGLELGTPQFKSNTSVAEESYFLAYWVKPDQNATAASNVSGTILSVNFRCVAAGDTSVSIATQIVEAYDRDYKALKFNAVPATTELPVTDTVLTAQEKEVFRKLLTITYPASEADIKAAEELFAGFTAEKQLNFKNANPELFNAYQGAWVKYWALAEQSSADAVNAEVNAFLNDSATKTVLALTPEAVTVDNAQMVKDVYKAFNNLSGLAKAKVNSAVAEKLTALNAAAKKAEMAAEERQYAEEALADYIKLYESLWNLSNGVVRDNYADDFIAQIEEAKASYGDLQIELMSEEKASLAKSYLEQLERYLSVIEDETQKRAAEAVVEAEVSAFMQKWADVLKLNPLSTTVGHEYAIEMMLADYEVLSADAQARLTSQKDKGTQLLQFINELKGAGTDPDPGPGEKPNENPEEKPSENPNVKPLIQTVIRETPMIVKIMLIVMFAGLMSLALPAVLYWIYHKKVTKGA